MTRFLAMFAAVMAVSLISDIVQTSIGLENYLFSTAVILIAASLYMLRHGDINELAFWLVIVYSGRNFEGWWYFGFFAILMTYIVISSGFVRFERK